MWFSHTFFLYSKYKCMYLKHNIDVCYEVLNFFISTGVVQHRCMHCFNNLCIGSIFSLPPTSACWQTMTRQVYSISTSANIHLVNMNSQ